MDILLFDEIANKIADELKNTTNDVNVISAYCKINTLEYIDSFISPGVKKRLLVRFLPSDLAKGSTDKEIFAYCRENGWTLYYDFSIHAKTYIFDKVKCILGSANLTNNGLNIYSNGNKEASTFFEIDDAGYTKIMTLYKDSKLVTDELFQAIVSSITDEEAIRKSKKITIEEKIECLMPEDFPTDETDIVELYNLKSYKWLISFLKNKENNQSYYGEITKNIHDIFVKDPRPFRKDIKQHLTDLLDCIKKYELKNIKIERPNYSEVITLIK